MQFAQDMESIADRDELRVEILRQLTHRMKAAVGIAEFQQRIVEHGIQAAAKHGKDAKLIIGPLNGV